MEDYKQNIVNTRRGGLGSSDAAMVLSVGKSGMFNESANQRIAVMLGIVEKPDSPRSHAMKLGDEIEMKVFAMHKEMSNGKAVSNPLFVSEELSAKYGFSVLNHIDIEAVSDNIVWWVEVKASKLQTADVLHVYEAQLAWHWMLLDERAKQLGKTPRLFLLHYPTNEMVDIADYDANKLCVVELQRETYAADIDMLKAGMAYIANALSDFKYQQPKEIEAYDLPAETQEALVALKQKIDTIKAYEKEIDDFKVAIKEQMEKYGVKSIKYDAFCITYVGESEKTSFDTAALKKDDPETYAKYYTKKSIVKSYVTIK